MLKGKRGNLHEHERAALQDHMLLVLEKNFQLEQQVSLGATCEGAGGSLTLGYSVFCLVWSSLWFHAKAHAFHLLARHTLGIIKEALS